VVPAHAASSLERAPRGIRGRKARLQEISQTLIPLLEPGQHARQVFDAGAAELPERFAGYKCSGVCSGVALHGVGTGSGHRTDVRPFERELIADELNLVHDRSTNDPRYIL